MSEDVEELRGVLSAISEFLNSIKGTIKEIIETLGGSLDGAKLGEEVAAFYTHLKESGVPEEMAKQMTQDFFKKKLESAPSLGNLTNLFTQAIQSSGWFKGGRKGVDIEEVIKEIDTVIEQLPKEAQDKLRSLRERLEKLGEEGGG